MAIDSLTPLASAVAAADILPISRSGADYQTTVQALAQAVAELLVAQPSLLTPVILSENADPRGVVDNTLELQAKLNEAHKAAAGNFVYGQGGTAVLDAGAYLTGPLSVSKWVGISSPGSKGSTALMMRHVAAGSDPVAMLDYKDDADQQNSLGCQPMLSGVALLGDLDNAVATEHGMWLREPTSSADGGPTVFDSLIVNFSGSAIKLEHHDQFRGYNFKASGCGEYGLDWKKTSDTKVGAIGCGRSMEGQVKLDDCASPQFSMFDFWNPPDFLGEAAVEVLSCQNARFYQGEINGKVIVTGDNSVVNGKTRYQNLKHVFNGVTFKVDPATFTGPKAGTYDSLFEVKSANGVTLANANFGWNQGDDAYKPKWALKIGPLTGADVSESGFIRINNVAFVHSHRTEGSPTFDQKYAFTQRITNREDKLVWTGRQIGELVCVPTACIGLNLVIANGAAINTDEWGLLWLTQSAGNDLDDGGKPATFTPPAYAPAGTPAHMTWCYVGWL